MKLLADNTQPFRTTFIYGFYRSGKTRFAATFPKPAILGSNREGGLLTVVHMPKSAFYEPHVPPQLYAVESPIEMLTHINNDILPQVAKGIVRTIVIELSFYSDDLIRGATAAGDNTWQKYADLESHIIALDARFKKIQGLRVVYTALAASEDDKKKPSGVLMAGRALPRKMPALCDVVAFMRQEDKDDHTEHVLHLAPYGNFPAGHRFGDKLPREVRDPSFRALEGMLSVVASAPVLPSLSALKPLK